VCACGCAWLELFYGQRTHANDHKSELIGERERCECLPHLACVATSLRVDCVHREAIANLLREGAARALVALSDDRSGHQNGSHRASGDQ
jgi:hypothetical protein